MMYCMWRQGRYSASYTQNQQYQGASPSLTTGLVMLSLWAMQFLSSFLAIAWDHIIYSLIRKGWGRRVWWCIGLPGGRWVQLEQLKLHDTDPGYMLGCKSRLRTFSLVYVYIYIITFGKVHGSMKCHHVTDASRTSQKRQPSWIANGI